MKFIGDKKKPEDSIIHTMGRKPVECPVCQGYGGWIDDDSKHYKGQPITCNQCNGWGYVEAGSKDATCIHKYKEISFGEARKRHISHYGMCYHVCICTKCEAVIAYDSSG
jgi:DnaJ-class molecular chaperone